MFKVYDKDAQDNATYLKLMPNSNPATPGVKLVVCDKSGRQEASGNILSITNEGTVLLHRGIHSDAPMQLDEKRRIKLEVDGETVSLSNLLDNAGLERRLEETQRQLKVARDQLAETEAKLAEAEARHNTAKEALVAARKSIVRSWQSCPLDYLSNPDDVHPATVIVCDDDVKYFPYKRQRGGRLCLHAGDSQWVFQPLDGKDAEELALAILQTC